MGDTLHIIFRMYIKIYKKKYIKSHIKTEKYSSHVGEDCGSYKTRIYKTDS